MGDARPPLAAPLEAFGVPATVTPPGGDPVATTAIWLPPAEPNEGFHPDERKRVLALPTTGLEELPSGSVVATPELSGGEILEWKVNQVEQIDPEYYRVAVEPA